MNSITNTETESEKISEYAEIAELADKARRGDQEAFEALYKRKSRAILYKASVLMGNPADAEDAASEIVFAMYKNIKQLKDPAMFNGWLSKIATRVCMDLIKKRNRHLYDADVDDYLDSDVVAEEDVDFLPAEALENAETREKLNAIIGKLPYKQRATLVMYYYDELTYMEIAYALDVTDKTVSTNLLRAKKAIKKAMIEENKEKTGGASALSALFASEALLQFPDATVAAFESSLHLKLAAAAKVGIAAKLGFGGAKVVSAKGIAISVAVVTAITGGTVAGVSYHNSQLELPPDPPAITAPAEPEVGVTGDEPSAPNEIAGAMSTAEILLKSHYCKDGHVNPSKATLTDIDGTPTDISWEIKPLDGSSALYQGTGDQITDELASLYETSKDGEYRIVFTCIDASGTKLTAKRTIRIDKGEITPGQYK
ncbi:MAG: RNA polymerase sigma factor [Clostridiales Family XIII bacterium]|nr:RNA polymerase sigma factor [Clostridiales Family XIII bacterium]